MKKLYLLIASVVIVASGVVLAVNVRNAKVYELARINLEALTGSEGVTNGDYVSFHFNNQYWHGTRNEGNGNWFPYFDGCHLNMKDGHQVVCTKGKGNCFNGTTCISD